MFIVSLQAWQVPDWSSSACLNSWLAGSRRHQKENAQHNGLYPIVLTSCVRLELRRPLRRSSFLYYLRPHIVSDFLSNLSFHPRPDFTATHPQHQISRPLPNLATNLDYHLTALCTPPSRSSAGQSFRPDRLLVHHNSISNLRCQEYHFGK